MNEKQENNELISEEDLNSLKNGEEQILKALKLARLDNRKIEKIPSLTKKIEKYIEKHSLSCSVDYIYTKMEEDDGIVASIFGKEPLKQNFTEKFIFKQIKEQCKLSDADAINLPSNTKTYFIEGELEENNYKDYAMKTVDFIFKKKGISYYCTQKYTTTTGSNQDDRYAELLHFVKSNSVSTKDNKTVAVALADGSYFKKKATRYKSDYSYFKYLKEKSGYCKVMTYLQFIEYLNNIK